MRDNFIITFHCSNKQEKTQTSIYLPLSHTLKLRPLATVHNYYNYNYVSIPKYLQLVRPPRPYTRNHRLLPYSLMHEVMAYG
jgi:hypothetical protein